MTHKTHPEKPPQEASLRGLDSAYSTLSLTTNPLFIARSRTKDIYRWRVMPDFAASESSRFTSFEVKRTVTGLAVSDWADMTSEMLRGRSYANYPEFQQVSDCLCSMKVIHPNR